MANLIAKHPSLANRAKVLYELIYNNLKENPLKDIPESLAVNIEVERAWYRYLYASTNFILSETRPKDNPAKASYLKNAFLYSPDITDKSNRSGFFYDMYFLFEGEKYDFFNAYLAKLCPPMRRNLIWC